MIVITRRLAKRLKAVFRLALNLSTRGNLPAIQLVAGAHGLRVRCGNGQAAAEFQLEGEQPEETVYIPFDLLSDIEGGREVPVEIQSRDGKVTASWRDGSVPQFAQHDLPKVLSENWPPMPDRLTENPPELLTALRDAGQTTDSESSRYALGCIQFCGDRGDVVATDGRQALVQSGFSFPWDDDLLVPANRVFGSRHLSAAEPVLVGRADDWAVFRIGPWTFWFSIESEARFPDVASQIGQPEQAIASCVIGETDRKFLLDNLPRLPGDDQYNLPVTVDLNGSVAIRGKQASQASGTELVLSASTRSGDPIRFNTNRRFLQRAAKLGFNRLHVFSKNSPVLACDQRRQYVWALLDPKSTIAPEENAVRIESATADDKAKNEHTKQRRRKDLATKTTDRPTGTAAQPQNRDVDQPDPIVAAQTLRDFLRETLQSTTTLIRSLKQHRKRTKAVESTLLTLKQLQAIDA